MINRCVIIVRAKQPFLDWLLSLPDMLDVSLDEINRDPKAYLLPFIDELSGQPALLEEFYEQIFEEQLAGWWTVEKDWPENRTIDLFLNWFDVLFCSWVQDLVDDEPLEVEEEV